MLCCQVEGADITVAEPGSTCHRDKQGHDPEECEQSKYEINAHTAYLHLQELHGCIFIHTFNVHTFTIIIILQDY